jgi:hypothetical protein
MDTRRAPGKGEAVPVGRRPDRFASWIERRHRPRAVGNRLLSEPYRSAAPPLSNCPRDRSEPLPHSCPMIHRLYVGRFATDMRRSPPDVLRPVQVAEFWEALLKVCDHSPDGAPCVASEPAKLEAGEGSWLARIQGEDAYYRDGYVQLPWMVGAYNRRAVEFAKWMAANLGCRILDPRERAFYTPEDPASIDEEDERLARAPRPRSQRTRRH